MNKRFHGFLIGISVLPALLVMPAMAADPNTSGIAFLFGDVSIADQSTIDNTAFGGRRMEWTEINGVDKYRNEFPKYQMVGRSFELKDSVAYVGPVNLTLRELTENDNLTYNYQQEGVDVDLAALAGVTWDDYDADDDWIGAPQDIVIFQKVAGVIGADAQYTAPGVWAFAVRDNSKTAGTMNFDGVTATIDGATVNANVINVTNGSTLTFVKQDPSSLSGAARWYTNAEDIDSDGKTALNADTITFDGSDIIVNENAQLTFHTVDGVSFTNQASADVGSDLFVSATAGNNRAVGLLISGNSSVSVDGNVDISAVGGADDSNGIDVSNGEFIGLGGADIVASYRGIRAEGDNSSISITGDDISISGGFNALRANNGASIVLGDSSTKSITLVSTGQLAAIARARANVSLIAENVLIRDTNGYYGVLVQNSTTTETDVNKLAHFNIDADNVAIYSDSDAVAAFSQGIVNIKGDSTISGGDSAIVARGGAQVYVNKDTNNSLKMHGNIDFNYDKDTSGTAVDAIVDVTMSGKDSYWTGNTVASYDTGKAPDESYMKVNSISLTMKKGATWNATKIIDQMNEDTSGFGYVAMNNLYINKGTVNIADMDRGIVVENATIADATFNGGKLNIGEMTLTSGTSIFNNDVVGVDADSVLTVDSGATMNIGTNNVNVNTITLNGTMLATVRTGDDAQITAATKFDGNGELKLSFNNAGTYKVFGGKIFDNVDVSSSVYDLNWDEGDLVVSKKSVEDIAADNNLSTEAATAISGMMASTSDTLNDLAVVIQEKLASGTDEERAEVEHAQAAIHPETESVVQSVSSSVQNTVTSLATGRMSMPIVGRNGGDVNMTSGGVWAQGIFNKSKQNDAFNGYTRGIAAGLDGTINKVWTIGAGYAFAHSDISGTARDTEIDSSSIFVYGQYKPSAWYMNLVANYTMADYSESGVALGTGISAKYDVDSFGANIATGYDFVGGITPELGLRYMHINSSDYINSLGIKNELADADYLTATLGTKYAFDIKATKRFTLRPELSYGVKYDMLSDKQVATVTMPGVNAYALNGERLSRIAGEFGIGLTMNYRELDVSLNYDIEAREDYTSQSGRVKFRYNF